MVDVSRSLPTGPALGLDQLRAGVRRVLPNASYTAGAAILLPVVLLALTAPWLPIADPLKPHVLPSFSPPSFAHPLGTDKLGREILSRTLAGLRISLLVGFASAALALLVGLVVGTLAGYLGKGVDRAVTAAVDVLLSFPALLLAITAVAVFGNGIVQVILALTVAGLPLAIRLQRALTLGLKSRAYIDAARLANAPAWWILIRHVVPNTLPPMIVVASLHASNAIIAEATLSFLGLGITPPHPSLGNLIAEGRPFLQDAWWISTMPGIAIALVSVSLHLFSDGVREHLDPRLSI
ncbi:MAG TPA: ABC transporter permease [Dehalococcoidia bacterium]|nr:ABC transporter permease [Dehalococcoidia bacterium]